MNYFGVINIDKSVEQKRFIKIRTNSLNSINIFQLDTYNYDKEKIDIVQLNGLNMICEYPSICVSYKNNKVSLSISDHYDRIFTNIELTSEQFPLNIFYSKDQVTNKMIIKIMTANY